MVSPQAKREVVTMLMTERDFGVTRACGLISVARSLYRYRSCRPDRGVLRVQIGEIAASKRRYDHRRVRAVLQRLAETRGLPESITVDHGPEFEGQVLDARAYSSSVHLSFTRPGKPNENAYIESFNGKFRDEYLNGHWFVTMAQARRIIEIWRAEYNTERPHSSLGDLTPEEYATRCIAQRCEALSLTADSSSGPD